MFTEDRRLQLEDMASIVEVKSKVIQHQVTKKEVEAVQFAEFKKVADAFIKKHKMHSFLRGASSSVGVGVEMDLSLGVSGEPLSLYATDGKYVSAVGSVDSKYPGATKPGLSPAPVAPGRWYAKADYDYLVKTLLPKMEKLIKSATSYKRRA